MKMRNILVLTGAAGPLWRDRLVLDAITKKLDKPIVFPQKRFGAFSMGDFLLAGMGYTRRVD